MPDALDRRLIFDAFFFRQRRAQLAKRIERQQFVREHYE